jgi:probable HAF family extracellular repeat protein
MTTDPHKKPTIVTSARRGKARASRVCRTAAKRPRPGHGERSKRLVVRILIGTNICLFAPIALAGGSITALDPLVTGTPTTATGISGDGSILVGTSGIFGAYSALSWSSSGTVTNLGIGASSLAAGISSDGSTIIVDAYTTYWCTFAYRNGAATILPQTSQSSFAQAMGVNADGSVIVGTDNTVGTLQHAVMWSGTNWATETDLGVLAAGDTSLAKGVSGDGTIVVGANSTAGTFVDTAFYWKSGVMTGLGFTGFAQTYANAISADGSMIVGDARGLSSSIFHPVSWSGTNYATQTDLGSLGGVSGQAYAVNADGSVIVGYSEITGGIQHAFRYANGTMADLNTLLPNAGVNMGTIVLGDADGVSANGNYIAANDSTSGLAYLVYYDGTIGGLTTYAAQQASVDALGHARQTIAIQQDAYSGLMIGDLDRVQRSSEISAFGLLGSAVGGLRGRGIWGENWAVTGGLSGGTGDHDALAYRGLMGAAALRYDFASLRGNITPFAQVGGSFGVLDDLTFRRTYANGAGTSTGTGTTAGQVAAIFGRLGAFVELPGGDQLSASAELGERWLFTDAYAEDTNNNPFPADVAAGTDRQTVGKIAAGWTHPFSPTLDMTLRGAVGTTLEGASGLRVATTGFGTLTTASDEATWAELGARLGWKATERTSFDLYATGIAGKNVGTAGHVGADVRFQF